MSLEYAYTPSRKVASRPEELNYNPAKKTSSSQENNEENDDLAKRSISILRIQNARRRALENPT